MRRHIPELKLQENTYDALVLCVDRHSGWMIAQPSMHKGLTAEKCAHLLLDGGWTQFGVPSTITSDQGPQFVGQWFVTMCSRLGLRESFSQSHYPQANGRAEVAGQQLISLLRKLHAENEINWVEALPRALRHIHDRVGEGGLSPHYTPIHSTSLTFMIVYINLSKHCRTTILSLLDFFYLFAAYP